jgi:thiamine biosynthesis protein ThiI
MIILCRFGELFLKLGNRGRFEQQLAKNVRTVLAGLPGCVVESPHGRIVVRASDAVAEEATARVSRVFGLVSISPAETVPADMEALSAAVVRAAKVALARDPSRARSFRIEARRADKRFPLGSIEMGRVLGSAVNIATNVPVDLTNPAMTIGVEVGHHGAFVYSEVLPAPGGLPVGTAGRGLLLLSGGIDSPVAGWLAAKRGMALDGLYFHSPPFVGEKSKDKVVTLARSIARWQALRRLYVVNFTETQKRLREAGPAELAVVLYRRMMFRVADLLADKIYADALITGENLGQVASQTLTNMTTIQAAARRLVLRPLVTNDKNETIALARRLDTFDVSVLPYEDCCSLFVPAHPATASRLVDVERAEASLDLAAEAAAVLASAEMITLTGKASDAPAGDAPDIAESGTAAD